MAARICRSFETDRDVDDRTNEILTAVRALIDEHNRWESDPQSPIYVPAEFEARIRESVEAVRRGPVPQPCMTLAGTVIALELEWDLYEAENHNSDGSPYSSFWKAYRDVLAAAQVTRPVPPRRVEPVKTLLEQKVSHHQIAFYIYGHNGQGPFLDHGQALGDLIEKEGREPGSVLGPDWENWIHPTEKARCHLEAKKAKTQLSSVDAQIGKAAQRQSHSLKRGSGRRPEQVTPSRQEAPPQDDPDSNSEDDAPTPLSDTDLDAKILDLSSAGDKSASEIVEAIKTEHSTDVTALRVSEVIRKSKQSK